MALTNSRPLNLLNNGENEILHNTHSPIFQFNMLNSLNDIDPTNNTTTNNNNNNNNNILPGSDIVDINDINPPMGDNNLSDIMTPTNTTAQTTPNSTPSGLSKHNSLSFPTPANSAPSTKKSNSSKNNASNNNLNNPIVEISKLIPVTGERPRPIETASQLDDNVLFAVFIILFDLDPNQTGMTVKQLCDHLLVKHPEMSNLSTKLSNLISAKLNAYVKKIEKGEKTLTYAISREWSVASPRRMLYIYRGILAPDYKEKAQLVASQLKKQMASNVVTTNNNNNNNNNINTSSSNQSPQNINLASLDNKQLNSLNFTLAPEFNIPYSSSPVSATLGGPTNNNNTNPNNSASLINNNNINNNNNNIHNNNTSNDLMKLTKKNSSQSNLKKRSHSTNDNTTNNNKKSNDNSGIIKPINKKQKSSSNVTELNHSNSTLSLNQTNSSINTHTNNTNNNSSNTTNNHPSESNYITAVAAAPRISKYLPRSQFSTPNNSSTNIHQLLTLQTPIMNSRHSGNIDSSKTDTSSTTATSPGEEEKEGSLDSGNHWIKIVREGFLTKEIDNPESISIDDLDSMF